MGDAGYCGEIIKGLFNLLSSLAWPLAALIIVCIFKKPIAELIPHIKKIKIAGFEAEIDDTVAAFSPKDNVFYSVQLQKPVRLAEEKHIAAVQQLSDNEIEQSKQRAIKRLEEDFKLVGYSRGQLYQLDSGKWAIAWKVESNVNIGVKDS